MDFFESFLDNKKSKGNEMQNGDVMVDWDNIDELKMYELEALHHRVFLKEGFSENYYRLAEIITDKRHEKFKKKIKKIKKQDKKRDKKQNKKKTNFDAYSIGNLSEIDWENIDSYFIDQLEVIANNQRKEYNQTGFQNNSKNEKNCAKSEGLNWEKIEGMSIGELGMLLENISLSEGKTKDFYRILDIYRSKENQGCYSAEARKDDRNEDRKNGGDNKEVKLWGDYGEKNVEYQIKWLGGGFLSIEKDCTKDDKKCILLKNKSFIDETQEFDHIIVSEKGVYLIETKHYKGELEIQKNGNWIRIDESGNRRGVANPIAQIDRHHAVISSILDGIVSDEDIHDIICISHESSIINGEENSPIPVVKVDLLGRFIRGIDDGKPSQYQIQSIVNEINKHKESVYESTR